MTILSHLMSTMRLKPLLLRVETAIALSLAWSFIFLLPFRWTKYFLGQAKKPGAAKSTPTALQVERALWVGTLVSHTADRLPWHSTCLVRALAGKLLLQRRGLTGARIRLGVAKQNGSLVAHAWLIYGPEILLGGEEAEAYTPLSDLIS